MTYSPEFLERISQMNPWLADPDKGSAIAASYIPSPRIERRAGLPLPSKNKALLLIGPRQAGKTTLIWSVLRKSLPEVLYLNLEDPLLRSSLASPFEFAALFRERYAFVKAVFLDEIQHLDEGSLFVKGLVDAKPGARILVTGSSSFHLRSKTRESLAGRAIRRTLYPLMLLELLGFQRPLNPVEEERLSNKCLEHLMLFGGYPAVFLARAQDQKADLLSDLVDALILRDASDLYAIRRIDSFRRLLGLIAGQTGDLVKMSEPAALCGVDVGTVSSYLEILEESHIVHRTRPFAAGKRRELTSSPKIHFIDNGVRNQLLRSFSPDLQRRVDRGKLFENWVFSEIKKVLPLQAGLHFWRSKAGAEVDFVIEQAGRLFAVEAKFSSYSRPKLSRSARSFIQAYQPEALIVVNPSLQADTLIEKTPVHFLPPLSFARRLQDLFGA